MNLEYLRELVSFSPLRYLFIDTAKQNLLESCLMSTRNFIQKFLQRQEYPLAYLKQNSSNLIIFVQFRIVTNSKVHRKMNFRDLNRKNIFFPLFDYQIFHFCICSCVLSSRY